MGGSRVKVPLHALPAFEAATRHGSFRAAAEELHLTPSAISHQIRLLEDAIGAPLFERLPRGLQLTDAGRKYAATVSDALGRLQAGADELSPDRSVRRLRVSLPDFVAHLQALPALSRFRERHPEIELEIQATMALADVEAGDVDAAVRLGSGRWGSLHSRLITEVVGTAVAAPDLAARASELAERGELGMVCLAQLEEHTRQTLRAAGLPTKPARALRLDSYMAVVTAVIEGLGVTVIYAPPHRPHDLEGLVALSRDPITVPFAMYFVCRPADAERPDVCALRDWLVESIVG